MERPDPSRQAGWTERLIADLGKKPANLRASRKNGILSPFFLRLGRKNMTENEF
jgi:hypothetical protein